MPFRTLVPSYSFGDEETLKENLIIQSLSTLTLDQFETVKQNSYLFSSKLKQQIDLFSTVYGQSQFDRAISANRLYPLESWTFPKTISPLETKAGLPKSLYHEEDKPNNFELRVINEVANLDNILFWHRNIERKGFWLIWMD